MPRVWSTALLVMLAVAVALGPTSPAVRAGQSAADTVTLRMIVTSTAAEAQRVLARLGGGEDFVTIARRESIDSTADTGGLLGILSPADLRPELRTAVEGVDPGHLSGIVRIPTGFAILEVVARGETAGRAVAANPAVAAAGAVKYALEVGGLLDAETSLEQFSKAPGWNRDPATICEMRTKSLAASHAALQRLVRPGGAPGRPPLDVFHAEFSLAELYAYEGRMDQAIAHYERAYSMARSTFPDAAQQMEEALGIAYLHRSEMTNGVYRTPGDRCLLGVGSGRAFADGGDSQKAIQHFSACLTREPDDLEVKWLLNLAYMTTGGYPEAVPAARRIPPSVFSSSSEDVGRFVDVAPQAGLTSFAPAGGVIVDDFDNDGRFDVATSSIGSCEPMHFFHRNPDGSFIEQAAERGLATELGGLNIIQADYDNDGCLDILVLRGAWELPQRKSLLHNNCNGTFTDVTVRAGLATPTSTQAGVWTDINNDGLLDLFVGNEDGPAQLFLNKGNGTFEDIAHAAGVDRVVYSKSVAAGDYDSDGWPDLYVSNLGANNFLYRNNHDGTFTELAQAAGVVGPGRGFASWFFDYDNDGRPDLFVASYFMSVDESARTYLGLPHNAPTLKLYRNAGDGSFVDLTRQAGLDKVFMPMGANFGDIDNDGFLDIYLGTGSPSYASLVPSVLLHNKDGRTFVDVTAASGTGELHKGHGVAFADLENDGNEDIVFEVGGAMPGDAHALRLFRNPGHDNAWINVKLVGVKTNRSAIGARITVTAEDAGRGTRRMYRTVGPGGSFGASPLQQHVGLGRAAGPVDVDVWWPTSGTRQHFAGIPKNQSIEIKEFDGAYRTLDRPRLPLVRGAEAGRGR